MKCPMKWWFVIALVITPVGCGKDVQLGVGPDAAVTIDTPQGVFATGTYHMAFVDPFQVMCDGSLTGNEGSFASITRANANLVDGDVMLEMPSSQLLAISGTPVSNALGQAAIQLAPDPEAVPPDFPQTIWDADVTRDFGAGPMGTQHVARYLGVDSSTATSATIEAAFALLFETPDTTGSCFASLRVALTPQ